MNTNIRYLVKCAVVFLIGTAFQFSAHAQLSDEECSTELSKICNGADANVCLSEEEMWDKVSPSCVAYAQTMFEMANEANAEMEQPIAPRHGNSDEDNAMEQPIAPAHGNSDEDNEMIAMDSVIACLETETSNGGTGTACIGQVSDTCMETGNDYSTLAMRQCISLEHSAWDSLLNKDYKALMASLNSKAKKAKVRDAQRHWIKFVDSFCPLGYELNQGTMYLISGDQCRMEMTARQDLELRRLLNTAN